MTSTAHLLGGTRWARDGLAQTIPTLKDAAVR